MKLISVVELDPTSDRQITLSIKWTIVQALEAAVPGEGLLRTVAE